METVGSGESPDWTRVLEKDNLTGEDLYTVLDGVLTEQNKLNPKTRPANFSEKFWDPTDVSLKWRRGRINIDRPDPDDFESLDTIHVQVDTGRVEDLEDFWLNKYPNGEVKAFWYRRPTESILLEEEFGDDLIEVPLTPERVKRISQVITSAYALNMAGANSR